MNSKKASLISRRSLTIGLCSLPILAVVAFYMFSVSAKSEVADAPSDQNLVVGRLVFTNLVGTASGPMPQIGVANGDGTGQQGITAFPPPPSAPSWSADGTKIVFVFTGAQADIYLMNSDGSGQVNLTNTPGIDENNPTWSSTGKIAYERNSQIWTMNPDGSNQAVFPNLLQPSPFDPAWSSDGSMLAYVSGGNIWKINANGTGEQQVTTNSNLDFSPSWSPDSSKIVFGENGSGISVINANGTNELSVTTNTTDARPAWSPDGSRIAFTRSTPTARGIWLADPTGGGQVRIIADNEGFPIGTTHDNVAWQPMAVPPPNTFTISGRITMSDFSLNGATVNLSGTTNAATTTDAVGNYQFTGLTSGGNYVVSPGMPNRTFSPANRTYNNLTGNQIANFAASRVCSGAICAQNGKIVFVRSPDIYTMDQDGLNLTNLTSVGGTDTAPDYSPDGTTIVFSTNRDGNFEIYRMNADGSNQVRLTNNSAADGAPYYSPDGASIAFVSNRDGNDEIYKMNADGSNQVRLTNDAVAQGVPAFSPDGQKIVYVTSLDQTAFWRQLWSMNADGSNKQQFPNPMGASHYYNHPSYSPDGQKIIFIYGDDITSQQSWTMNANGTNRTQSAGFRKPTYSPDGTKIVSSNPFFMAQGIWTSDVGGANLLRITTQFDELPDWQPIQVPRRTAFDFDGDTRADLSFFRPTGGYWYVQRSTEGLWAPQWGLATDTIVPGDYDGDGKSDLAVWRESNGNYYVLNSFDSTVRIENFGLAGDVPLGGDWDADGKTDVAVWRSGSPAYFYYRPSNNNPTKSITFVPWGTSGDKPMTGDFDGDGWADAAVYRNGTWYIRHTVSGQTSVQQFGIPSDTLVPADYDGDGKTDIAVFRSGVWYLLQSTAGFMATQFGIAGDVPAPADYDGDGRADITVYRNGVWWIRKSQSGAVEALQFGGSTDKPIPSAYVR